MKSEGHVDTNKLSASRKDKNSTKCADLKPSRCCNMKSCLSTQDTTRKRESTTSEFNADVNFDDKHKEEFHVNQQNEELAHDKRKLPRKTKGFNVKSKLRKTFTMCCASGQDTSLDEEDENEYDNIERGKRADEDETNGQHTSDEPATAIDKQPNTGGLQQLQNFWKIPKPYHITEDPNMCSAPTNVLQVYASDLTTSDSSTSASSDSILALLDEIDADSSSPVRCTDLKDLTLLRSFNIDANTGARMQTVDIFRNNIKKPPDNRNAHHSVPINQHTTFTQNDVKVTENQQQNCRNDQIQTTYIMDSTVPVNSQLNANSVFVNQPPTSCSVNSTENSNNGTIRPNSNSSVQHKRRLLYDVYTMLLSGEIGFVRLQGNELPGADDGNLVEFIYSNSGFSHEEARDILKAINRLINNKVIEFKFSEDQASARNFTVSSFNGEKLTLSQDVVSSVSEDEVNSNEQNSSLDGDEASKSKVSAVVNGIFDAADNCDKKMRDYITMIRDKRFPNVLEDILRAGEGTISSVTDYVDILRDGNFPPVFDDKVDVNDSDNSSQLQGYIRTITEGHFCTALENALKDCKGNSYSLSDYIEVIRDEHIVATLGLTLLASELPDEYVQLLFQGTGDGDLSNSSADTSTPCSISVEMLRRVSISTILKNIARKRALQNTDLLVKNADDFISRLSAKGQSHGTSSDVKEPEVKFSDVDDYDPMSVCDGVRAIRKMIANCHDVSPQSPNIIFVDDALFRQGDTDNENLQSSKHATYKAKENSAKWAVSDPIVRPKTFNRSSTKCGSTYVEKNRSKSKYNVPKTQSSGVTIETAGGTSMLDNVSGATEVKRSKAEYAMDLSETEDTSNTTGVQDRVIKTARRRTRRVAIQENEFAKFQLEPETETVPSDEKKGKKPTVNVLSPLRFIDTDVEVNALKEEEATPVYIETEATIDYGRCAVEPGHGERPDKKKLRAEIKEKVKTKGEANKHLRNERECYATDYDAIMEEYFAENIDDTECGDDIENEPEQQEEGVRATSPVVLNAVDQPQVLDDREFHMVPDEIKRADDPYLEDVKEDYKVWTTHSNKKEKRKQKDDRKKEKRVRKGGQTVLKLS